MKTLRCLVIDDEELARDLLENYISQVPHLQLVGKCVNAQEAMAVLEEVKPDLIFLDIQMPKMTGIEFLKSVPSAPAIIFTTAYENYALEGYELSVLDYLLKPFDFKRFMQAINKASELIQLRQTVKSVEAIDLNSDDSDYLMVNASHKIHRLAINDIIYIQSMREYVVFHTEQEKLMSLGSLKALEERLPTDYFLRIHKSYIVAKKIVKSIEGNRLHLKNITLPVGGIYKQGVLDKLFA